MCVRFLQVVRTYDSRDKQLGDFGYSWNVGVHNVRVEKSHTFRKGWFEDSSWSGEDHGLYLGRHGG